MNNERYKQPPDDAEEEQNPAEYFKHYYHYLKRTGDYIWKQIRSGELIDTTHKDLDSLTKDVTVIRQSNEIKSSKYPEDSIVNYWIAGIIHFCDNATRVIEILKKRV